MKIGFLYDDFWDFSLTKNTQRSFVQIMDSRNYIFYASGVLSEGQQQMAQEDETSRQALRFLIERCFLNAMCDVFYEETAGNPPYTDVQIHLSADEAFGIASR